MFQRIFFLAVFFIVSLSANAELKMVKKSTVLVVAVEGEKIKGTGTGFFVSRDGYLVTNQHVTAEASSYIITGSGIASGTPVIAKLVWEDKNKDLALLKISSNLAGSLKALPIYEGEIEPTTEVYSFGYPDTIDFTFEAFDVDWEEEFSKGFEPSVTKGIVSRIFRSGKSEVVQHTAEIRKGNSGGPLVDECGRLLGVNTWGTTVDTKEDFYAISSKSLLKSLEGRVSRLVSQSDCKDTVAVTPISESIEVDRSSAPESNTFGNGVSRDHLLAIAAILVLAPLFFFGAQSNPTSSKIVEASKFKGHVLPESLLTLSGFDRSGSPIFFDVRLNETLLNRGLIVGRSHSFADLVIKDDRISRAHLLISYEGNKLVVMDLNSSNGSFVNGIQLRGLQSLPLRLGNDLRLSNITLKVAS